ncbi:MAG: hypothetical protein CMN21_07310 [Rubinisphaera sp.]|nr:hypothetical protein [Rubinisphaera sp.]|tara:strand:- start:681 stop:1763 length:1083 start_codon:yes stop_codon:yes gene_type:complete
MNHRGLPTGMHDNGLFRLTRTRTLGNLLSSRSLIMTATLRLFDPFTLPDHKPTLREFYDSNIYPEIVYEQAKGSISCDRTALNHWERHTPNRPIDQITKSDLASFRDGLRATGAKNNTINKYWRELRSMFNWAEEDGEIIRSPTISRRSKSKLTEATKKIQRESLTLEEVTQLWEGCAKARYPSGGEIPAPKLWRTAIVLFWFYGARTIDFLQLLTWENVKMSDRLLQFTAQKTSKLQGLPLTDLVMAHLESIKRNSTHVFPGFRSKGSWLAKPGKWKNGYYTTWRRDIQGLKPGQDGILIKHFRETMLTRCNGIDAGLGNWIAGHYMPGVSAQNYDLPTARIREAIAKTPVPDCFYDLG